MSKPLLILDLDGTLIYTTEDNTETFNPEIIHTLCNCGVGKIYKRPGVDKFLEFCFRYFDVAIWTASGDQYADHVIGNLFTREQRDKLVFIFTSDRCTRIFNTDSLTYEAPVLYIKVLNKVFNRHFNGIRYSRERTLILDDTPYTYCRNYGCAIPIPSFRGQDTDHWLTKLETYLLELLNTKKRWRSIEKRYWWQ